MQKGPAEGRIRRYKVTTRAANCAPLPVAATQNLLLNLRLRKYQYIREFFLSRLRFLMMTLNRLLLASGLLVAAVAPGHAADCPKDRTTAAAEARHETARPGFTAQGREARRIAGFLGDALLLTRGQRHAVAACTVAAREALALAATEADAAEARRQYQVAMCRVLGLSQREAYGALCRHLAGTALPLDGTELAAVR